ncbi:MAG: hypothetical protein ACLFV8_03970 [Alphaproteobacteria bacterium]
MSGPLTIGTILAMSGVMAAAPAVRAAAPGEVGMLFHVQARDGGKEAFEAGYKRHLEWHRRNRDTWRWPAWEILTGERAGHYLEGTFGHEWPGLDRRLKPAEDAADHETNVDPYVSHHVRHILIRRSGVSRGHALEDADPAPFLRLVTYRLRPGTEEAFEQVLTAMHRATEQVDWHKSYAWYALVDGGPLPLYLLVIPVRDFAGLAPSEQTIPGILSGGPQEGQRHLAAYRESVVTVRSELLRFREDLSYLPKAP